MDRARLRVIADRFEQALKAVAAAEGLTLSFAGGNFTAGDALLKFKVAESTVAADGAVVVNSRERSAYVDFARTYGLQAEWLDREFRYNFRTYKVVGLNTAKPKYPVMATRDDGRSFKFTADQVRFAFTSATAKAA